MGIVIDLGDVRTLLQSELEVLHESTVKVDVAESVLAKASDDNKVAARRELKIAFQELVLCEARIYAYRSSILWERIGKAGLLEDLMCKRARRRTRPASL